MLKNKYALDLDYNFYLLREDFEKYIFPEEEIKYILDNKSSKETEDNGKIIFYDHKHLYLIPGETAEQLKLNSAEKIELLRDISNIKIKDITPENIKEISLLVHYSDYLLPAKKDNDVTAYEMPINLLYQKAPFQQKMFHLTEEAQFRKNDTGKTEKNLTEQISTNTQDKVSLSNDATEALEDNKTFNFSFDDVKSDDKKQSASSSPGQTSTQTSNDVQQQLDATKKVENTSQKIDAKLLFEKLASEQQMNAVQNYK